MSTNDPHLEAAMEAESRAARAPNQDDPTPLARRWRIVVGAIAVIGLLAGAYLISTFEPEPDYTARFVRYTVLQDGTRVAVVTLESVGATEQQTASTDLNDLQAGERVSVRWVGKSWETPQWRPDFEVVSKLP